MTSRPTHIDDADRLMTRLIDGEAGEIERHQFAERADADPALWRELALRFQDAVTLIHSVERETAQAVRVDLAHPAAAPARRARERREPSVLLTLSGWAAVLIIALSWAALATMRPLPTGNSNGAMPVNLTSEEHFQLFMERADYVLGTLPPSIVDVETLPDGRIAIYFIRRIEEVAFLAPDEIPYDDEGNLTPSLLDLRRLEAAADGHRGPPGPLISQ